MPILRRRRHGVALKMLRTLDLFSGIGGFALGLERTGGFRTVAFCEIDPYCRAVLRKHWPDVLQHEDIRTLDGAKFHGQVDMITGGVPCQPASVAGKRKGSADERWLWPEFLRIVREARPMWVLAENPTGIISVKPDGLAWIEGTLQAVGYETQSLRIGANDIGAPHRRKRIWIVGKLADAELDGRSTRRRESSYKERAGVWRSESAGSVQLADAQRVPGGRRAPQPGRQSLGRIAARWPSRPGEPQYEWERPRLAQREMGFDFDGLPGRLAGFANRNGLRAVDNSVIPQVVEMIGHAILEAHYAPHA